MDNKRVEVYDILNGIKKLDKKGYDNLIIKYGQNLVDKVIEEMIDEKDSNVFKFEYYISSILFKRSDDMMDSYDYYINDLSLRTRLSNEENRELASEIINIVDNINKLFKDIEMDAVNGHKSIIVNGINSSSLVDKIEVYLGLCDDSDKLNKLKILYNQFFVKRDSLVEGNLRFVIYVAKMHYRNGIPFVEIVQSGNLGLIKAAESYNPNKFNTSFAAYAYYWIRHYIVRSIKSFLCPVTVSHRFVEKNNARLRVISILSNKLGRVPTNGEIAEYMNLPVEEIELLDRTFANSYSIYGTTFIKNSEDGDNELILINGLSDRSKMIEDDYIFEDMVRYIRDIMLCSLTDRERFALEYRYGLIDGNKHTLEEVGRKFGITREGTRQLEERAIRKLRKVCYDKGIDGYLD